MLMQDECRALSRWLSSQPGAMRVVSEVCAELAAEQRKPGGPRQADALEAIAAHWRAYGQAPTRTEIGRALGICKVSAHLLVKKLAADGLVVIEPGSWRNVRLA